LARSVKLTQGKDRAVPVAFEAHVAEHVIGETGQLPLLEAPLDRCKDAQGDGPDGRPHGGGHGDSRGEESRGLAVTDVGCNVKIAHDVFPSFAVLLVKTAVSMAMNLYASGLDHKRVLLHDA
jgi:hypothetical protein